MVFRNNIFPFWFLIFNSLCQVIFDNCFFGGFSIQQLPTPFLTRVTSFSCSIWRIVIKANGSMDALSFVGRNKSAWSNWSIKLHYDLHIILNELPSTYIFQRGIASIKVRGLINFWLKTLITAEEPQNWRFKC